MLRYIPMALLIGISMGVLIWLMKGKKNWRRVVLISITFFYICLIVACCFANREAGSSRADLIPGSTIDIHSSESIGYAVLNIVLFLPFGFILPCFIRCVRGWGGLLMVMIYAALGSMLIEFLQLFTQLGLFQSDDIIMNTCGAMIGYILFSFFDFLRK